MEPSPSLQLAGSQVNGEAAAVLRRANGLGLKFLSQECWKQHTLIFDVSSILEQVAFDYLK